jgi:F0F1-type ATP synthase membrane subunit c/vacuolar-type H+-ATPase subunit K
MVRIPKLLVSSLLITLLMIVAGTTSFARADSSSQGTLGVARVVTVKDKNIKDGSIMSNSSNGIVSSTTPYDPQVIGVVSRDAGIIMNDDSNDDGVPIISEGTVYVLVSAQQGAIKKGDLITTSTIPGVGVKALKDGYVLGTALEDYTDPKPGLIAAEFNLQYFNAKPTLAGSLTDIFKLVLLPTKDSPAAIYKYIVAAFVVIASFVLAFLSFGRTAAKGIEALGRNPAASRIIHLGIIFNVGIVVVIVLAGLTVAFLILRL